MPDPKDGQTIPDAYRGREPAYIKHRLLEAYLEKLFLIVGMSANRIGVTELCYIDCFAGPWGDDSADLGSTSIARSLAILESCRRKLEQLGKKLTVRALYIEKDRNAYARLDDYVRNHSPEGVSASARHGDFLDLRPDILDWCGSGSFAFFFVDPTGWSAVSTTVLAPLLQRPHSEFLITFMYDFVNRTAAMADYRRQISELLGAAPDVDGLPPRAREKALLDLYRANLKARTPSLPAWPARSAYFFVQDRTRNRTKYHLVYLTSHPRGVIEFMRISEKLEPVQKRIHAETKQRARIERSGQQELLSDAENIDVSEGHASSADVEAYWRSRLSEMP